ncbi:MULTISPECIES: LysR family transcriptional regulator [unclassified Neptuniibacter]|jgi:DNA-binding transcriptional LysR family regulator|uniref:LysR family transcriptional regulator n=1 Tax=unclassified Neptuniibacter TaxID=2630693 RepID=UPI0026E40889|nr:MULTISPECIES: LysR family transcriptional regulator [unclassified Neptuniibacter]MDO6513992.1 LysR family transcriptional regulator [Neptuniibacter sp. 2_MG-2023]MDO6594166.1 LysR family transcriptional regulator [Neptuniibacter sp. 1_MG-2023]
MNKLKAMAIFVKIVESGSLNGAADKLSMSQSSVVRALAALENTLGVQLLYRTTRRLTLTEEGRDYCQRCRQILLEVEDAENALTQRQIKPSGKIRITAPMTFGRLHLAPIINDFLTTFPETEVELLLLDRVVDLIEEGMDIALRIGQLPDSTLIAKQIGHIRYKVCASPAYIQKAGIPSAPTELSDYQCIRLTGLKSHSEWAFKETGKVHKISVSGPFKTNHIETALDACAQGLGYCQFLSYQVDQRIASGELTPVLESFEPDPVPVNLVYPHSRLLSSRSRYFIEWAAPRLKTRLSLIQS